MKIKTNDSDGSIVKKTLLAALLSLLVLVIYSELSQYWISFGGLNGNLISIELPVLSTLVFLLLYPSERIAKSVLLTAVPIILIYILYDAFYVFLVRSPRISDFTGISNLSDFSPMLSVSLYAAITLLVLLIIYSAYQFYLTQSKPVFSLVIGMKIVALLLAGYFLSSEPFQRYMSNNFTYISWSQSRTIQKNGRLSSSLYYTASSKKAKEKLKGYKKQVIDVNKILFDDKFIDNKRNVYIAILESFIDPRLIKDASYSRSPLSADLHTYLRNEEFSYTKAPIYGGGTPQSEFEILTGSKALAKIDSIEFNTLGGRPISGFVNALKGYGYKTSATIATNSSYYNSKAAYASIGFDKTLFMEEDLDKPIKHQKDKHIFDGDLFTYNVEQFKKGDQEKPFLHYSLGMYGHFPYYRNKSLRPDVISTEYVDKRIERIANQFFYRTEAISRYIESILAADSTAIIFIAGDHLPPLISKGIGYKRDTHDNISLLLDAGSPVNLDGKSFYEIPRIIWSLLSNDKEPLSTIDEETYEDIYFKMLSDSL